MDFSHHQLYPDEVIKEFLYRMRTVGYYGFPDFFNEETCDYYKAALQRAVDNYTPFGSERSVLDRYLLHDLMCRDVAFSKKLEDPRLDQILSSALAKFWIMYAYTSSSLPPHGSNYGGRVHVDSPRFIENYPTNIGLIWALDDFTLENGCTKVLPGSHNSPETPSEELFEKHCERLTCKKGALIVFNARVFHRSGENKTAKWRHSLTMNVCRPYMKQRCDWVRFIPPSITDQLNKRARRIIGFDTRLPTSLEEFFVPDSERLYKPNQE